MNPKVLLREFRHNLGISQMEFAHRAGLSLSYYSDLESEGKPWNPTVETLTKITGVLGISLAEFFVSLEQDEPEAIPGHRLWQRPTEHRQMVGHRLEDLRPMEAAVATLMVKQGFSDDDVSKTRIGLRELYLNALSHGHRHDPQKCITVSFFITPQEIRLAVKDEGGGFDPRLVPDALDRDRLAHLLTSGDESVSRGRGLLLTRLYTDNLRVTPPGNLAEITKFNSSMGENENPMHRLHRMTITSWARLVEYRDPFTGEHIQRLPKIISLLCQSQMDEAAFGPYLTPGYVRDLKTASILHDIGKVGISDSVLLKKGPLTPEEFAHIKDHAEIGGNFLEIISKEWRSHFPDLNSYFDIAVNVARHHHERWDGKGYPRGLSGESIPLSARLVSVADVYDALTYHRPYRAPLTHTEACRIIEEGAGTAFDPRIVAGFSRIADKLEELAQKAAG